MLDKFIQIIEENNFGPEDIETVRIQPHPMVQFKMWRENRLRTPDDYCFSAPYLLACAVHRINRAHWHDPQVRHDPKIRQYIQWLQPRLSVVIGEEDFAEAKRKDPLTYQMRIEVTARGKTFKEKMPYLKGTWEPEEFRNTDEELVKKFTDNASRILSLDKASKAAQTILGLEKLRNAAEVMEIVAP